MTFILGKTSLSRLEGVDQGLVRVVKRAIEITDIDFTVLEGLRTKDRQAELFRLGASRTLNSRHLTGHAVDVAPFVNKRIPWHDLDAFETVARAMFQAADELGILIQWGGDWDGDGIRVDRDPNETFMDGPHFQIPFPYRIASCVEAQKRRKMARYLGSHQVDPKDLEL